MKQLDPTHSYPATMNDTMMDDTTIKECRMRYVRHEVFDILDLTTLEKISSNGVS